MALFNLLFFGYIWLIQPSFLRILDDSYMKTINIRLGVLLLLVPMLEIFGLILTQSVQQAFRKSQVPVNKPSNAIFFFFVMAMIMHLGFACLYLLFCFQFFSLVSFSETTISFQLLVLGVLFIGIAKEGLVMVFLLTGLSLPGVSFYGTNRFDQWVARIVKADDRTVGELSILVRGFLGNVLLFVYAVITFTVMWDFMFQMNSPTFQGNVGVLEFIGLLFYFFLIYLPLCISSLLSELNNPGSKISVFWKILSIFLLAIFCIIFGLPY
jgi:hypothetical protein